MKIIATLITAALALHLIGPGMTAAPTFEGTIVIQE